MIDSPSHVPSFTFVDTFTMALSAIRQPALRVASRRYPALRGNTISRAAFSTTPRWQIRTKEMSEDHFKDLKVNKARLMRDIHHTCQWGTGERWGEYVNSDYLEHQVLMCLALLQRPECLVLPSRTLTSKQEIGSWRRRKLWAARLQSMRWAISLQFGRG